MLLLYDLGIQFYLLAIRLAAFFNKKARLWWNGRENWYEKMRMAIPADAHPVWIHCASLGEFEQGRPVIESLKQQHPDVKILLTFFSPSGYEIRKNYAQADYVFYLPADTARNARKFLHAVQPRLAIFVKYEFWYHYLHQLSKRNITTYLISAIFHPKQPFFNWYGRFFRRMLPFFTKIFVQNEASAKLLRQIDVHHFEIAGDTRIDRVVEIAKQAKTFPIIEQFVGNQPVLTAGSSWPPDEAILLEFINQNTNNGWKYIFAPHDISESHILQIVQRFHATVSVVRFSQATDSVENAQVLIIDNIGMLSSLYRYGKIAYIGGGFGAGIHNTLEPIAFGLPVLFGPKYEKFEEAVQLVRNGGAFVVKNTNDFSEIFLHLNTEAAYQKASQAARNYVIENQGATERIIQEAKW